MPLEHPSAPVPAPAPTLPPAPASAPPAARPLRNFLAKALLLGGSLLVAFLLVEVGLRLLGKHHPRVWVPDPEVGWHHIPGARTHWTEEGDGIVQINSLGYRDRERSLDKPAGTFRIAVFGDSMTEAVQVNLDQTYTYLLEEKLAGGDVPVEALNFGINGYGPIQELLLFKREAPRYRPDLVIVAVLLDNDIADSHPGLSVHGSGSIYVKPGDGPLQFDHSQAIQAHKDYHAEPVSSLRKWSASYRFASHTLRRWKARMPGDPNLVPRRFELYDPKPSAKWQEAWTILERVLVEFRAEARRQNVPLVVLSVPAGHAILPRAWQGVLEMFPAMQGREWDLAGPDRRLRALAKKHDLMLLQPAETFRRAPEGAPLFFGNVGHMTARGHEIMAGAVYDFLRDKRLIQAKR